MEGHICISVAADSAREFVARAKRAADTSAAVELRFDSLPPDELDEAIAGISGLSDRKDLTLIGTYRSSEHGQGGSRLIPVEERCAFWRREDVRNCLHTVDVEFDLPNECLTERGVPVFGSVIRSHHDLRGVPTPDALAALKLQAKKLDPGTEGILKIAGTPQDITDAMVFWDQYSTEEPVISLGMGEFGLWTRILGLSRGAPVTYAAQDDGMSTAPGQIEYSLLSGLYRAEKLARTTEIYGIVGKSSLNSLSPFIHNPAFIESGRDAVYLPLPVKDADQFYARMVSPVTCEIDWNLRGLSITHPHKETFARLVDELHGPAKVIGAVNTVLIEDGKVLGFNTDAEGFIKPLQARTDELSSIKVGIVGTGGAAKAAGYALRDAGAEVVYFSRDPAGLKVTSLFEGAQIRPLEADRSNYGDIDVLVNATPVGSRGELVDQCPVPREAFGNLRLAYDMIYNPENTRFLAEAQDAGVPFIGGLEMLIEQAVLQYEIWTGSEAPREVMRRSAQKRLARLAEVSTDRNTRDED